VKSLLTSDQIGEGITRLAAEIHSHYEDRPVTIIAILTGSIVLLADLIRHLEMPLRVALIQASSYRGSATEPGTLHLDMAMLPDITGRHVLVLDDIFDTGVTLSKIAVEVENEGPASVRTAVLLRKEGRQQVELIPDFVAFDIPDEFVVGYGLDYNDLYRNLPFLAALEPHEIQHPEPQA
jgi:hypoxanthine phosphoribosyltransferase